MTVLYSIAGQPFEHKPADVWKFVADLISDYPDDLDYSMVSDKTGRLVDWPCWLGDSLEF